jgi:hypothetical protein
MHAPFAALAESSRPIVVLPTPGGPFRITTRCPDSLTVLTLRPQSPLAVPQPLPSPARLTATWAMPKHAESRPWAGP